MTKIHWQGVYQSIRVLVALWCDGHEGSTAAAAGLFFGIGSALRVEERRAIAGHHAPALR